MTLQEKLSAQSGNEHRIHLFKEGKFWKAYESSAFLFTKFVKKYKVQKKMVKCMAMPVASLGFPEEVFKSVVKDVEVMEVDERYRILSSEGFLFSFVEFDTWKNEQPFVPEANTTVKTEPVAISSSATGIRNDVEKEVLVQIRSFGVESRTPLECMMFLTQIQRKLYGDI